jgi:hypothetical protein
MVEKPLAGVAKSNPPINLAADADINGVYAVDMPPRQGSASVAGPFQGGAGGTGCPLARSVPLCRAQSAARVAGRAGRGVAVVEWSSCRAHVALSPTPSWLAPPGPVEPAFRAATPPPARPEADWGSGLSCILRCLVYCAWLAPRVLRGRDCHVECRELRDLTPRETPRDSWGCCKAARCRRCWPMWC